VERIVENASGVECISEHRFEGFCMTEEAEVGGV
jgi:hypothetical protein